MPISQRAASLDIARGAAIVMVVFLHASQSLNAPPIYYEINVYAGLRMPLLLVISGYLTARSMTAGHSLGRRSLLFAWLFTLWSLITLGVRALVSGTLVTPQALIHEWLLPTSPLWYIWALSLLTLTLPLVRHVSRWWILAGTATVSMLLYTRFIEIDSFAWDHVLRHTMFFFVGALCSPLIESRLRGTDHRGWLVAVGGIVLCELVDGAARSALGFPPFGLLKQALACVIALQLAVFAAHITIIRVPFAWLGRNALPIFLGHVALIELMSPYAELIALDRLAVIPLAVAVLIMVSLLIHRALLWGGAGWMYALPSLSRDSVSSSIRRPDSAGPLYTATGEGDPVPQPALSR